MFGKNVWKNERKACNYNSNITRLHSLIWQVFWSVQVFGITTRLVFSFQSLFLYKWHLINTYSTKSPAPHPQIPPLITQVPWILALYPWYLLKVVWRSIASRSNYFIKMFSPDQHYEMWCLKHFLSDLFYFHDFRHF